MVRLKIHCHTVWLEHRIEGYECSVHPHLGQTHHYPFVFIDNYSGSRSMPPAATSEQN
jgi:hypothetical protein